MEIYETEGQWLRRAKRVQQRIQKYSAHLLEGLGDFGEVKLLYTLGMLSSIISFSEICIKYKKKLRCTCNNDTVAIPDVFLMWCLLLSIRVIITLFVSRITTTLKLVNVAMLQFVINISTTIIHSNFSWFHVVTSITICLKCIYNIIRHRHSRR